MTTKDRTVFDEIKARGEEFFTRMSGELMSNPGFTRALQAAGWGKEKLDQAVGQALKGMRIPTRGEFDRALQRIAALEDEVDRLKLARRAPARRPAAATRPRARRAGGSGSGAD